MIIRALDANHDWVFGSGKSNYLKNDDAIALNIDTRLLSWVGDCFFDMGAGIDWLNLLGSIGKQEILQLNLKRVILQSYGVTGINSFYVTLNSARLFQASYNISTIFSPSYQNTLKQSLQNA
jgi:hypothetical protein